jgi:hypothetical protein
MLTTAMTIPVVSSSRSFKIWALGDASDLDLKVELLGAKSPGSSPAPTHLGDYPVPARGVTEIDIPMDNPAFNGGFGAIQLTSYQFGHPSSAYFSAWASPSPDYDGNPASAGYLIGTVFTIPHIALPDGYQFVLIAVTNIGAAAGNVTFYDPRGMTFNDTVNVASMHTTLWSSKKQGYDMTGNGQVAISAPTTDIVVSCAIDRSGRIFHLRPPPCVA